MSVKLLTEHYLEFLSLKGDCTCSCESALVKMPHCWESHVAAQLCLRSCADPGISVRGEGGGSGQSDKKAQLILQKSNAQFQRNLSFFKVPEGVQHFPGGPTFSRGGGGAGVQLQLLIPYRYPYNL